MVRYVPPVARTLEHMRLKNEALQKKVEEVEGSN